MDLSIFHEILERRGDEWAKKKYEEAHKEVANWSKEKWEFEAQRGFQAINENLYEIEKQNESLEGKNWNEITLESRFEGDAEKGKNELLKIISSKERESNSEISLNPSSSERKNTNSEHNSATNSSLFFLLAGLNSVDFRANYLFFKDKKIKKR